MSLADFEARYQVDPDPWRYATSDYERDKYAATLAACGEGPFTDALELGASIGVFTELLAPRCELADHDRRRPDGDRGVVASEILYYLTAGELARALARIESSIVPGGRVVATHWRPAGPERPLDADQVHTILRGQPWLTRVSTGGTDDYRLDVLERI